MSATKIASYRVADIKGTTVCQLISESTEHGIYSLQVY